MFVVFVVPRTAFRALYRTTVRDGMTISRFRSLDVSLFYFENIWLESRLFSYCRRCRFVRLLRRRNVLFSRRNGGGERRFFLSFRRFGFFAAREFTRCFAGLLVGVDLFSRGERRCGVSVFDDLIDRAAAARIYRSPRRSLLFEDVDPIRLEIRSEIRMGIRGDAGRYFVVSRDEKRRRTSFFVVDVCFAFFTTAVVRTRCELALYDQNRVRKIVLEGHRLDNSRHAVERHPTTDCD